MKINVRVHAGSSQEKIADLGGGNFEIWIKEKAINGRANESLIKILRKYFDKEVKIASGFGSKRKIIELRS